MRNSNHVRSRLPHKFQSSYNYLIHYQSERLSCSFSGPKGPPVTLTIEHEMVNIVWAYRPISFWTNFMFIFIFTLNHILLEYRCPIYCCIGLWHAYLAYKKKLWGLLQQQNQQHGNWSCGGYAYGNSWTPNDFRANCKVRGMNWDWICLLVPCLSIIGKPWKAS